MKSFALALTLVLLAQASTGQEYQPQEAVADQANEYYNEQSARGFTNQHDLVDLDQDRKAFEVMINRLLWDSDEEEVVEHVHEDTGRSYTSQFHRRGLLGRSMPAMFRDESSFTGVLYKAFINQAYDMANKFGLGGLASSFEGLF